MRRTLFVMLKEPRPGWVKTRLARDIGTVGAAWWYRHQVSALLRQVTDPRWQTVLAVSPDVKGLQSGYWPWQLPRVPQGGGDLGARMARLLRSAPPGPACVVGSDIPGADRHAVARAFEALGRAEVVFGPAMDGGFWLVGSKRVRALPPRLFQEVAWSTDRALADSVASLPGCRIAYVDRLRDVDGIDDLAMTLPRGRASSAP